MGTSVQRTTNMMDIYKIGLAYDMPSYPVDGMDPESVHNAIYEAAEKARLGEGPTFLEIRTYRYKGHSMSDPQKYRTKEEVEEYKMRDPVEVTRQRLLDKKYANEKEIEEMEAAIEEEIKACVEFAEQSPYPDDAAVYEDIYMQQDYPFITD